MADTTRKAADEIAATGDTAVQVTGKKPGLAFERFFTRPGVHPYDELEWELRDAVLTNWRDQTVSFEQRGVEFPSSWSMMATQIVAQKYFRGTLGTPERERSVKQMIDRVADTITGWGLEGGYFADEESAEVFHAELKHLLVNQKAAFNSPVWFNVGVEDEPQCSACFILQVEDTMSSILNWYVEEGTIFKGGSGAGINLSSIRSSKEILKGGGEASGPVSLHARRRRVGRHDQVGRQDPSRGQDGDPQRRPPRHRGVHLDQGQGGEEGPHPARGRLRHGPRRRGLRLDPVPERQQLGARHRRVHAGLRGGHRPTRCVRSPPARSSRSKDARDVMRQISQAAWECADPGLQYDTTINDWHTSPESGRINGSNPCSEYMHLDNSACNLASLNLKKFYDYDAGRFDVEAFKRAVEVIFTAQEIIVGFSLLPDRGDRQERARLPRARPRLRQPRWPADVASGCPTTPTRVVRGPARSRR